VAAEAVDAAQIEEGLAAEQLDGPDLGETAEEGLDDLLADAGGQLAARLAIGAGVGVAVAAAQVAVVGDVDDQPLEVGPLGPGARPGGAQQPQPMQQKPSANALRSSSRSAALM
jgi:hypothetical protein